jgi:ferrous iron transport protein A
LLTLTFKFDKAILISVTTSSLATAALGAAIRIATVDLDGDAAAWLAAVGLHVGEELVVLRRAALGGPIHVRTGSGGEFAVARELAAKIAVEGP